MKMTMATQLQHGLTPDADRMLHIKVPEHLGNQVDVLIAPTNSNAADVAQPFQRTIFWDTAFARDVLNSDEENCWNDL